MRSILLGLVLVSISGCGLVAIPPALTIASYAADGISYLVSGKSLTDHAISEVAEADCAMWRMIKMQNPCLNEDGEAEMLIAFDGDPYDPPPMMNEPDVDWGPAQPGEPEPAGEALADAAGAVPAGTVRPAAALGPEPQAEPNVVPAAGPETDGAPTVVVQDLPPPAPAAPAAEPAWQNADAAEGAESEALMAVTGGQVDDPDPLQLAALRSEPAAPSPETAPSAGERRFLVIGSFADRANAERLARANPRLAPLIAPAEVSGQHVYRVVTETAAAGDADLMRRWLTRNGFASAWPIARCESGAAAPDCLTLAGGQY